MKDQTTPSARGVIIGSIANHVAANTHLCTPTSGLDIAVEYKGFDDVSNFLPLTQGLWLN
ncbi:hypothetical protein K435DRAFT_881215 [Dendrothele bispora CBS 962.96]|uniref:Uncharacterized protein n=1 Tax=Dendrothele bispora (strain CBS 962.96) TaxID=1314807 RepID=A0A4S8KIQ4_DENBC|nr:hypothetical protein K435DRAFT_881215 [Dendrothele bispora CBS 962.96]